MVYSELAEKLSTTVSVCEKFLRTHKAQFRDFPRAADKLSSLAAELEELKRLLNSCVNSLEIFTKDVSLKKSIRL
jgi:hypothetical protein